MSDNLPLGKINPGNIRDAFHVPVLTVELGAWDMLPGDKVVFHHRRRNVVVPAGGKEFVGIIDPLIDDWLSEGQKVLLWLKPGIVTGMEHKWQCPIVDMQQGDRDPTDAETWLEQFAQNWGFDYQSMIAIATNPPPKDEYGATDWIVANGKDLHSVAELGDDYDTFWEKIEELNGCKYDQEHRGKVGWSCTC